MSKKELDIKTFRFDEFQKKVEEGMDNIGFNSYKRNSTTEMEEGSIDDQGEGKNLDIEKDVNVDIDTEESPEMADTNSDSLDTGDQDVSVTDVEEKIRELLKVTKIMKTTDLKNVYKDINAILSKYPL